jgi:hypothetical protein
VRRHGVVRGHTATIRDQTEDLKVSSLIRSSATSVLCGTVMCCFTYFTVSCQDRVSSTRYLDMRDFSFMWHTFYPCSLSPSTNPHFCHHFFRYSALSLPDLLSNHFNCINMQQNAARGYTAVKMSYLETFSKSIDQSLSTSDVVTKVIIPGTNEYRCR